MGTWDKDKLFAPNGPMKDWVDDETEFIVRGIEYKGEIEVKDGPTPKAHMTWFSVSPMGSPDKVDVVSMLGDLAKQRADDAEPDDFPAVCITRKVPSGANPDVMAHVVNFVRMYDGDKGKGGKAS